MLLEHRNERAGTVVTGLDRSGCYFVTGSENLKRVHQSQLAPPFIESQIGLRNKNALNCPPTTTAAPTKLVQGGLRPRFLVQ